VFPRSRCRQIIFVWEVVQEGLQLIEAGRAAVIIANNPIFIALLSALLFKERLNRVQIAGILLSVAGAVYVVTRGHPLQLLSGGFGPGELLIFGCVLSWVTFSLVGKTVLKTQPPLTAIFYAAAVGSAAGSSAVEHPAKTRATTTISKTDNNHFLFFNIFHSSEFSSDKSQPVD